MKNLSSSRSSVGGGRFAMALLCMSMLVIGACHDRNPTVQQPFGPTVPSTSPTSTTPRQPASGQSVMSPAKPASAPAPSGSHS